MTLMKLRVNQITMDNSIHLALFTRDHYRKWIRIHTKTMYSEFTRTLNGGKRLVRSVWFVHALHLMAARTINFPCMRHGIL